MFDMLKWRLKQTLRYSPALRRKPFLVGANATLSSFSGEQQSRYRELSQQYDLSTWPRLCTRTEFVENLYLLDWLTRYAQPTLANSPGIDIGCRNFCHLPALYAFHPSPWTGVEVDAYARYWHGYTRAAYGEFMAQQFPDARYQANSLLDFADLAPNARYGFIYWSLPFLFRETQQAWRLPATFFAPHAMLQKALDLLSPKGSMLIVNQGELERNMQAQMLAELGVNYRLLDQIESVFSPFKKTRYAWRITKRESESCDTTR